MSLDFALMFMRLFVGYAFMVHGWGKMQNPMAWMGPEAPVPGLLQFLAAFAEFGGGAALILGLLTRLGALGILITMVVASGMHLFAMKDPLIATGQGGSAEPALNYLFIALLFVIQGPGRHSLDKLIFGSK
jgi:putative oxidoreductase